jgi:hypothetical protein
MTMANQQGKAIELDKPTKLANRLDLENWFDLTKVVYWPEKNLVWQMNMKNWNVIMRNQLQFHKST